MFDVDLLAAFGLMGLLFLRHVAILKKPNKINYAPLMVTIGIIAMLIHFILHPEPSNTVLLIRESLKPLLAAMILYMVMNILNQTKESYSAKVHEEFTQILAQELSDLKHFILDLERRLTEYSKEERAMQQDFQQKFQDDLEALGRIYKKQQEFTTKLEHLEEWGSVIKENFENFTKEQLPQLDSVVHKHLEMLRIAEQEHYTKITALLERTLQSRDALAEEFSVIQKELRAFEGLPADVAKRIVEKSYAKLAARTEEFEGELITLKLHAEGVKTTLYEDEMILGNVRSQSELLMKQMRLSAQKMEELFSEITTITKLSASVESLVQDVEAIRADYVKAQSQLSGLAAQLQANAQQDHKAIEEYLAMVRSELKQQLEAGISELQEHYSSSHENMTESFKILTKQAQLQRGYGESLKKT